MKPFILWLEEKQIDHLKHMLLKRLGFEPKSTDVSSLKLRDFNKNRLNDAISQMNLDPDKVNELQNWVLNNPDSTLQNLIDQITFEDIPSIEEPVDLPNKAAKLPIGQEKPQNTGLNLGNM